MRKNEVAPLRVALYVRVSGQEQAIKGLSLEAQQESLEEYAREHRGRFSVFGQNVR